MKSSKYQLVIWSLKNTLVKLLPHLSGAIELKQYQYNNMPSDLNMPQWDLDLGIYMITHLISGPPDIYNHNTVVQVSVLPERMQLELCGLICLGTWMLSAHLTHWGKGKMDAILQMTFSNAFPWMKIYEFFLLKTSQDFVPWIRINNIPVLVQIMAWHWPGAKPLSEPMMVSLLTHICVTRAQ